MSSVCQPKTLLEAVQYFSDKDVALTFFAGIRWPNGVSCPRCDSREVGFLSTRRIWKCRTCHKQFSAKVGTVLEDSAIPLEKWMPALWLIVNCKNGISSYELGRALGVTQKTGWFMLSRLRLGMQDALGGKLDGHVEVDETYIGGKARNMHRGRREESQGPHLAGQTAVTGLLQRHPDKGRSRVRLSVLKGTRRHQLMTQIEKHVEDGSNVYTDALPSYDHLTVYYKHAVNQSRGAIRGRASPH